MRIGEAARQAEIPTHRLRHYEATGLLVPDRSTSDYRDYTPEQVDRAKQIKALLDAGFNTADITLMLPCLTPTVEDDRRCCAITRGRLRRRLQDVQQRRQQLQRTEAAIADWLAQPH